MCTSDSLEPILLRLSTKVLDTIADGRFLGHLSGLLKFLATWEKRPACLIQIAHQWCSAISQAAQRASLEFPGQEGPEQTLNDDIYEALTGLTPACSSFDSSNDAHHTLSIQSRFFRTDYIALLCIALEVGFRPVGPGRTEWAALGLNRAFPWGRVLDAAISSGDDETIADALSVWIMGGSRNAPPGSFVPYLARRIREATPFSPRLRWIGLRAIEFIPDDELETSGAEVVHLLGYFDVDVDEVNVVVWEKMLISLIGSPAVLGNLPPRYWCLLGKLVSTSQRHWELATSAVVVMKSLEDAEDWEKLEVWMVVMWRSILGCSDGAEPTPDVEWATLKLLLRQPLALPRFEAMCKPGSEPGHSGLHRERLQRICTQVELALSV